MSGGITISPTNGRIVKWDNDTHFGTGTLSSEVEISGTGDDAVVRLGVSSVNDDDIPYTTEANYTLSDGTKLEVAGGNAALESSTGSTTDFPFDTSGNYTFDDDFVEITGSAASLIKRKSTLFDGVDEYLGITDDASLNITDELSVFAAIKHDGIQSNKGVFTKWGGGSTNRKAWWLGVNTVSGTQRARVLISEDGSTTDKVYESSVNITTGWHMIGFTFSGGNLKIYVDGVEDTSVNKVTDNAITTIFSTTSQNLKIGADEQSGSPIRWFKGNIDDCMVWDTAILSSAEILALYNSGNAVANPQLDRGNYTSSGDLVTWIMMGENASHPTYTDKEGSNDATAVNMESGDIEEDAPSVYATDDSSTVVNNTGLAFAAAISSFEESATKPGTTSILYNVSSDDGVTFEYWNGASWATADGTSTQANNATTISANISSLAASGTFKFKAFLISDGPNEPSLDNVRVIEGATYPTDDDLYIETKDTSQIDHSGHLEWTAMSVDFSEPASTDVGLLLSVDGRSTWLTYTTSWVNPTDATDRDESTSISVAEANFSTLPVGDGTLDVRLFLKTDDEDFRPTVSNINVTSSNGFETSGTFQSNQYNSTYIDLPWEHVISVENNDAGSSIQLAAKAANSITELDAASYTDFTSGEHLSNLYGIKGQYFQYRATFSGTATARPSLDTLSARFRIPDTLVLAP